MWDFFIRHYFIHMKKTPIEEVFTRFKTPKHLLRRLQTHTDPQRSFGGFFPGRLGIGEHHSIFPQEGYLLTTWQGGKYVILDSMIL